MALTRPRAYQIYDIDYKQAVRVVTVSNVTLSGGAPNSVDGVTLSLNDRVLVTAQSTGSQNGIYYVTTLGTGANGTWSRSIDTNATGELLSGTIVMVTEGTVYADTQWKLTTNDPITIGSTSLTFVQNYLANSINAGLSNVAIGSANANVTVGVNGTSNVAVFSSTGVAVTGTLSATGIVSGLELTSTNSSGSEGGQVNLAQPASGSTLAGGITIDAYNNLLRFFEQGGTARGAYIDLTACSAGVGTDLLAGGGGGTPGGSNTYVQFNDGGSFGGNGQFVYNKVTNLLTVGSIAANTNGLGTNYAVGDDAWIGDINTADTIGIKGAQSNGANGFIVFGNSDATGKLGRSGTGPLTYAGAFSATGNITGGNILTGGLISATGNITGGNILGGANVNATTHTGTTVSVTGNITGGGHVGTIYTNSIINTGANGTGNIGSASLYFNTAFIKATSAQYADLAEMYVADQNYTPGTVVVFGGSQEITITNTSHDTRVAGIISTNPSYLMNSGQPGDYVLPVALTGRVPCRVVGPVQKGDRLVSSEIPGVAQVLDTTQYQPGAILGKSLEDWSVPDVGTIEVAVGRT